MAKREDLELNRRPDAMMAYTTESELLMLKVHFIKQFGFYENRRYNYDRVNGLLGEHREFPDCGLSSLI